MTTTLRVPTELRDEIARIAEERGTTMLEVVADAVHRLGRDDWWSAVHDSLDDRTEEELADYRAEAGVFDSASADGLDGN